MPRAPIEFLTVPIVHAVRRENRFAIVKIARQVEPKLLLCIEN